MLLKLIISTIAVFLCAILIRGEEDWSALDDKDCSTDQLLGSWKLWMITSNFSSIATVDDNPYCSPIWYSTLNCTSVTIIFSAESEGVVKYEEYSINKDGSTMEVNCISYLAPNNGFSFDNELLSIYYQAPDDENRQYLQVTKDELKDGTLVEYFSALYISEKFIILYDGNWYLLVLLSEKSYSCGDYNAQEVKDILAQREIDISSLVEIPLQ